MDYGSLFIETFEKIWDGVIIGIVASIIWLIMSQRKWSVRYRVFLAFTILFALTFVYSAFVSIGKYYSLP